MILMKASTKGERTALYIKIGHIWEYPWKLIYVYFIWIYITNKRQGIAFWKLPIIIKSEKKRERVEKWSNGEFG